MEKEFIEWFDVNKNRFAHGQFDEKQIAYSAWLEGQKQALRIHDVVGRSEQFNCLGGNYAKGIKPCEEWCGEDMCQKPSN